MNATNLDTLTNQQLLEKLFANLTTEQRNYACEYLAMTPIDQIDLSEAEQEAFKRALGLIGEWPQFAKRPRSDQDILRLAKTTMCASGSSYGTEIISESHVNNPPRIWIHTREMHGTPCFFGRRLIDMARRIYRIEDPVLMEQD